MNCFFFWFKKHLFANLLHSIQVLFNMLSALMRPMRSYFKYIGKGLLWKIVSLAIFCACLQVVHFLFLPFLLKSFYQVIMLCNFWFSSYKFHIPPACEISCFNCEHVALPDFHLYAVVIVDEALSERRILFPSLGIRVVLLVH